MKTKNLLMRFGIFIITILFVTNCSLFKGDDDGTGTTSATNTTATWDFTNVFSDLSSAIPAYMKNTESGSDLTDTCIPLCSLLSLIGLESLVSSDSDCPDAISADFNESNPTVDINLEPGETYFCVIYSSTTLISYLFVGGADKEFSMEEGNDCSFEVTDCDTDAQVCNSAEPVCTAEDKFAFGEEATDTTLEGIDLSGDWTIKFKEITESAGVFLKKKQSKNEGQQGGAGAQEPEGEKEMPDKISVTFASENTGAAYKKSNIAMIPHDFTSTPIKGDIKGVTCANDKGYKCFTATFIDEHPSWKPGCNEIMTITFDGTITSAKTMSGKMVNVSNIKAVQANAKCENEEDEAAFKMEATWDATKTGDAKTTYADLIKATDSIDILSQIDLSLQNTVFDYCPNDATFVKNLLAKLVTNSDTVYDALKNGQQQQIDYHPVISGSQADLTLGIYSKNDLPWDGYGAYKLDIGSSLAEEVGLYSFTSYNSQTESEAIEVGGSLNVWKVVGGVVDYNCGAGLFFTTNPNGKAGYGAGEDMCSSFAGASLEFNSITVSENINFGSCDSSIIASKLGAANATLTGNVSIGSDGTLTAIVNSNGAEILRLTGACDFGGLWYENYTDTLSEFYGVGIFYDMAQNPAADFSFGYNDWDSGCWINYHFSSGSADDYQLNDYGYVEPVTNNTTGQGGAPTSCSSYGMQSPLAFGQYRGIVTTSNITSSGTNCTSNDYNLFYNNVNNPTDIGVNVQLKDNFFANMNLNIPSSSTTSIYPVDACWANQGGLWSFDANVPIPNTNAEVKIYGFPSYNPGKLGVDISYYNNSNYCWLGIYTDLSKQ
jgi:hypothetical protein